jgi:transcriptional regulator with XRE-family HTH domain
MQKQIREKIRELERRLGLSHAALAVSIGLSETHVREISDGVKRGSRKVLDALEKFERAHVPVALGAPPQGVIDECLRRLGIYETSPAGPVPSEDREFWIARFGEILDSQNRIATSAVLNNVTAFRDYIDRPPTAG